MQPLPLRLLSKRQRRGCTDDDDGSGELEIEEFTEAVREECGLSDAAVSEQDISELFGVIDADAK